jgi:dTDP-4-amino-4,6-dideoxygalactose transaminase
VATNDEPIPFLRPSLPDRRLLAADIDAIYESGRYTNGGAFSERLAAGLASYSGAAHCVPVSSGTVALMLLIEAAARPAGGGKVLMPSFTFAATALAVEWAGYEPVFCDVDESTWQPAIDTATFGDDAGEFVLALACNTFGAPSDLPSWRTACETSSIPLVVDSAAGFGASYPDGRKFGATGVPEIFSLHATKTLSAVEGGAIATNDRRLADHLRLLTNFGMNADGAVHGRGLNAKMSEFHAAIACRVLERYDEILEDRRATAAAYRARLEPQGFRFQPNGELSPYQFVPCTVPDRIARDDLIAAAAAAGIECRKYFSMPLHREARYAQCERTGGLGATQRLADRILSLPMSDDMAERDIDRICTALTAFVERTR